MGGEVVVVVTAIIEVYIDAYTQVVINSVRIKSIATYSFFLKFLV